MTLFSEIAQSPNLFTRIFPESLMLFNANPYTASHLYSREALILLTEFPLLAGIIYQPQSCCLLIYISSFVPYYLWSAT